MNKSFLFLTPLFLLAFLIATSSIALENRAFHLWVRGAALRGTILVQHGDERAETNSIPKSLGVAGAFFKNQKIVVLVGINGNTFPADSLVAPANMVSEEDSALYAVTAESYANGVFFALDWIRWLFAILLLGWLLLYVCILAKVGRAGSESKE